MAKILIVDDEPNMLIGLKDNLEFESYEVGVESIMEVWSAEGITDFHMDREAAKPVIGLSNEMNAIHDRLARIEMKLGTQL